MDRNENFDRQYRLSAGKAGTAGFEIGAVTKDCPQPLHIEFKIQKTDLESNNIGTVTVWNLSQSHIDALSEDKCVLTLRAGYGNRLPVIFSGLVNYASTEIDKADRKTEIEVIDDIMSSQDYYVSVAYNGTVNWKSIVEDVGDQIGVAISYGYNVSFVDIANGYSYVGPAKNVLTKACDCCGLSWSIQNGILQIKRKGDVMNPVAHVLSPETGMIGIPARVVVSEDRETGEKTLGYDVEYFLNGAIQIDDYVQIKSKNVNGYFRVYSLEITGSNVDGDWLCKARVLEV